MVIDQGSSAKMAEPELPRTLGTPLSDNSERKKVKFLTKEILDRIGYGLSSQQFLNILFVQSGASLFLVGMLNGLKVMVSVVVGYLLERFALSRRVNKILMSIVGILFGVSIFCMTVALARQSLPLFIFASILASIIAVLYGTLYQDWFKENLEMDKRGFFLSRISYYGLGITGISMFLGAYLADRYTDGKRMSFMAMGQSFAIPGFVAVLILAALFFMFAAVIMLMVGERAKREDSEPPKRLITKETWKALFSNKVLLVLFITSSMISLVQTLATAYYGIFIFQYFGSSAFGGFMNVAIIFIISLLTSIVGPMITQFNVRAYGKFPMLVFGTLLLAIGPLTYYYNPNLLSISVAMFLSTIGSAICGISFGLLTLELISEDMKHSYSTLSNILIIIPYALLIPIGSLIAQAYGMQTLFLVLTLLLIAVVVPLYMLIIFMYTSRSQKI